MEPLHRRSFFPGHEMWLTKKQARTLDRLMLVALFLTGFLAGFIAGH